MMISNLFHAQITISTSFQIASGTAARLMQEADGYRQRVIASAEGDTSRFRQVLAEYAKAPQVTRERMYLEAMQEIFTNTSKVYVDSRAGNNLLYLPLDRLMQQAGADHARAGAPAVPAAPVAETPAGARSDGLRSRDRDSR